MSNKSELDRVCGEYLEAVNKILITHYDASIGFTFLRDSIENMYKEKKLSQDQLDNEKIKYGKGDLNEPAVAAVALIVAWVVYDRFIAPPPNVRQAYQLSTDGESLAEQGDLRGALAKFEAAAELDPSEPEYKVWMGVLLTKLDEVDQAEASYQDARSLYATELAFYLERGMMNLRLGDLEAAGADAEKGVASNPESGWPYMLRANVRTAQGDYNAAVADMEKAAELASRSGDTQLEAYARTQRGMVIQLQAGQMVLPQESVTPSPDS